uniref:Uncharacterized protein n=2 Tax=Picea TaxID=3328 RepID=A0A101LV76_PICGL|nr:hypothetical protein ABT39_MTgene2058 [Picea glauca]QHR92749.1 hypothetical protein Q903MT_gene6797 [Picea sitchensis]
MLQAFLPVKVLKPPRRVNPGGKWVRMLVFNLDDHMLGKPLWPMPLLRMLLQRSSGKDASLAPSPPNLVKRLCSCFKPINCLCFRWWD